MELLLIVAIALAWIYNARLIGNIIGTVLFMQDQKKLTRRNK